MYRVGDIVCATYGDFDCEKRVGIFLIIYSEKQDRQYSDGHSNYTVLKITSNNFQGDGYVVKLRRGECNLDNDCLINVGKVHTLSKDQIYRSLGTLSQDKMLRVYKEFKKFIYETELQMMELI